jgi:hypothetical protein
VLPRSALGESTDRVPFHPTWYVGRSGRSTDLRRLDACAARTFCIHCGPRAETRGWCVRRLRCPTDRPRQEDKVLSHPANRARCSCSIAMNFTPIPCLGLLRWTAARARTSPVGASMSNWMKVPTGGGSGVRMNSPPRPRLSTTETALLLNLCQATIVPFGAAKRG